MIHYIHVWSFLFGLSIVVFLVFFFLGGGFFSIIHNVSRVPRMGLSHLSSMINYALAIHFLLFGVKFVLLFCLFFFSFFRLFFSIFFLHLSCLFIYVRISGRGS